VGIDPGAAETGAKIFVVDESHFYADVDLRGKWVLNGEPALVGSPSPRNGETARHYSAVCLETDDVETMEPDGNSCAETSQRSSTCLPVPAGHSSDSPLL
jgi:hypothetical protein